jgi:hypothetical protein
MLKYLLDLNLFNPYLFIIKSLLGLNTLTYFFYLHYYIYNSNKEKELLVVQISKIQEDLKIILEKNEILLQKIVNISAQADQSNYSHIIFYTVIFLSVASSLAIILYFCSPSAPILRGDAQNVVDSLDNLVRRSSDVSEIVNNNNTSNLVEIAETLIERQHNTHQTILVLQQQVLHLNGVLSDYTRSPDSIGAIAAAATDAANVIAATDAANVIVRSSGLFYH